MKLVSASLYGANKNRSAASLQKKKADAAGYGGHFRAVQSFRYIEGIDVRDAPAPAEPKNSL